MLVWSEGAEGKEKTPLTDMGQHLDSVRHLGTLGTGALSPCCQPLDEAAGNPLIPSFTGLWEAKGGQWQLQVRLVSHEKEKAEGDENKQKMLPRFLLLCQL